MATIICGDNNKVNILESHIHYFQTIKYQIEECDTTVIHYNNLHSISVKAIYDYLVYLLDGNVESIAIQNRDIPSLLMTADFLMCQPVFKHITVVLSDVIQNAKDTDELRVIFEEKNKWEPEQYTRLQKENNWCQKINHCKSKFL